MNSRERLRQRFNQDFENWNIELSPEAMSVGTIWLIVQQGWTIWTRFDINADDSREYLDYYAMHRMTNDRHVRLYADGDMQGLPTMSEGYVIPRGATNQDEEEIRREYLAYNQSVQKLLEEKGFVMTDQAHPSAQINRWLQTRSDTGSADEQD